MAAVLLVASDPPRDAADVGEQGGGLRFAAPDTPAPLPPIETFAARDGATLGYRLAGPPDGAPMLLIHGSAWHGAAYMGLARALGAEGLRVIVPDLRGHGPLAEPRGDIGYIGQLEDDLADLLDHLGHRQAAFAGHSSGGGLVIRAAGGPLRARMTKAVLIAPFLKHDAPTARPDTGGWTRVQTRRIIGLSILNALRITALNHLAVIRFNLPRSVRDTPQGRVATPEYSYRLNVSLAPRSDYLGDVARLPEFLLIAGAEDEAFRAEAYAPTLRPATDLGRYTLLPGLGHLDILDDSGTAATVAAFLAD